MRRVVSANGPGRLPLLVGLLLLLAGCASTVHESPLVNHDYIANPDRYEILGPVTGEATVRHAWIFRYENGGGYREAYRDALGRRPGATTLINTYSDVQEAKFSIPLLGDFFLDVGALYRSRRVVVYGLAARAREVPSAILDPLAHSPLPSPTLEEASPTVLRFARGALRHDPGGQLRLDRILEALEEFARREGGEAPADEQALDALRTWVEQELEIPWVEHGYLLRTRVKNLRLAPRDGGDGDSRGPGPGVR